MATKVNFSRHRRNATFPGANFQVTDNAETPVPLDLTNVRIDVDFQYGARTAPVARVGQGRRAFRISSETTIGGVEKNDPTNGEFRILPFVWQRTHGLWRYDITLTFPDGLVLPFIEGELPIEPDLSADE